MTGRVMLVLKHGYTGTSGLGDVERRAVTAEHFGRRPFRKHRERRGRVRAEFLCCVYNFSTDVGKHRFDVLDVLAMNGEVVFRKDGEVSELAWSKDAFFAGLT